MKTLTWLHFSDLHLCRPKTGWEVDHILEKFRNDMDSLQKNHHLHPDLIFFTGDAVFGHIGKDGGKSITEQFEEAALLFVEIREIFNPQIPIENFFIVPGNHEVNRSKVNPNIAKGFEMNLKGDHNTAEKELSRIIHEAGIEWKDFVSRLSDYCEFLKDNNYSHLLTDEERLIYAAERKIGGIRVGIAGLNSSWSCYQDNEKGKLWLAGHWQIQSLKSKLKNSDITIALMHHPMNWFNEAEDPRIQKEMENHFHFLLHGHEHQEWVTEKGNGFTSISCGAGYGDSESETGYNIVRLNLEERTGEVWLRRYDKDGGGWVPKLIYNRTDNNGVVPVSLWAKNLKQPDQKISQTDEKQSDSPEKQNSVNKDGGTDTPENNPEIHKNASEARGVFGRDKEIEKIATALTKNPIIFVYGMPGIGKTILIEEINKHPLFQHCKYFRYSLNEDVSVAELFRQLAKPLGCREENPRYHFKMIGQYDFSPLKKFCKQGVPCIIHLENTHSAVDKRGFKNPDIKEFLLAITQDYPGIKIVLESRNAPTVNLFPNDICKIFKIQGIDREGVARYFQRPFREFSDIKWDLNENEKDYVFRRLGGKPEGAYAHPLTMTFLANVADGMNQTPVAVLKKHRDKLLRELEQSLFQDLYEQVLKPAEQHILRLCALYREGIPDSHVGRLNEAVRQSDAFSVLTNRCLLNPNDTEEWYYLHSIIAELTESRMDKQGDEYLLNHEIIADSWLSQLKLSSHPSLPNIKATNQALHHLLESQSYLRLHEISEKLLNQQNIIPNLEKLYGELWKSRKYDEYRCVLELIIRIDPGNHKAHRFLGEIIERFEGKGNDQALIHYEEAHRLDPAFPPYLANIGRCLIARRTPEIFISLVKNMDRNVYKKVINDHILSIYATCLTEAGQHKEASQLRMDRIQKGVKDAVFYTDQAKYLSEQGKYDAALEIIEKAEQRNCANEFTISIKAGILEAKGDGDKASQLRMEQIQKGSKNPVFYCDEAKYLSGQGKYDAALEIIEKAEQRNCADEFTISIKAGILETKGDSDKASQLRMTQILKGSKNPAFYSDEVKYLRKQGKYDEASEIIEKAEQRNCANEFVLSVKKSIFNKKSKKNNDAQPPEKMLVFLSHAEQDRAKVQNIYEKLEKAGFTPRMETDILPGQNKEMEIRRFLKSADFIMVCLSPQSVGKRGSLNKHLKWALEVFDEMPEGSIFLIPVKLEECELPERLSALQPVELYKAEGFEKLLSALKFSFGKQNLPDRFLSAI
ncbi:MAG: TIR domain-containing protein [Desulfococcaceae bacterium]